MTKYLRNTWYVAAESTEVANDDLFARRILNEPVVIYRLEDGSPVALRDRCPHRYLALSMGKKVGDTVQCGYHGMVFDKTGSCIEIPTQDTIPETAYTKSYPIVEKYNFLWIWMGDIEKADESLIPDFSTVTKGSTYDFRTADKHPQQWGYKYVRGNYQLMVDNLLDLSHVGFVHTSTLGSEESTRQHASGEQKQMGRIVSDYRLAVDVESPPAFAMMLPHLKKVDFWLDMHCSSPCNFLIEFGVTEPGKPREEGGPFTGFHILTPETEDTCHYYYGSTLQIDGISDEPIKKLGEAAVIAFDEDLVIIEAQQKEIQGGKFDDESMVALRADKAALMARRLLTQLIKEEEDSKERENDAIAKIA